MAEGVLTFREGVVKKNELAGAKPAVKNVLERLATWAGFHGEVRGGDNKILQQGQRLNEVLQKAENGQEVLENDFATVVNTTYFLRQGIDLLEELGPEHTKSQADELPVGGGEKGLLKRAGTLGERLIPMIIGTARSKLPDFLLPAYDKIAVSLQNGVAKNDEATKSRLASGKRLAAGLVLSKEVEKYGVWGRKFDEESFESAMAKNGLVVTDAEKTKAQEVHKKWNSLSADSRMTLKVLRDFCYTYGIHPDSLLSPAGIRRFNPNKPLEPGDLINNINVVKKDGTVVTEDVTKISVYDLLKNHIEEVRYKVGWAHIQTLADKGYIFYDHGTAIRLHSWRATEAIMEIAGAGTKGLLLDIGKSPDAQILLKLFDDTLKFGGDETRQRFHRLVSYSTLYHKFNEEHGIPVKFTEKAADADWSEGNEERLKEYLDLDPEFALATRKYTTGEYLRTSQGLATIPDSFDGLLETARAQGENGRVRELERTERRALQLMRMFMAPKGGWTKKEPAAYQIFNYVFGPGGQKQEVNIAAAGALMQAMKEGTAIWMEGKDPVTGATELIFKGAADSPGYFSVIIDPKTETPVARYVNLSEGKDGRRGYVMEVNVRPDGTAGDPQYRDVSALTNAEFQGFLTNRSNYRTPGWMKPLYEAAGASPWQGFDMGDVMGGVLATVWEQETLQRRIVAQARGEMYDPQNARHQAEIIKFFYKLRTNLGGGSGRQAWGLEFSEQYQNLFGGAELDPTNRQHIEIVAAKAQGVEIVQWLREWRTVHGHNFNGGLDERGNPNSDLKEVLNSLVNPKNWQLAGSENGLFIDLTQPVWQKRLRSLQFLYWRFEQARKTFTTIIPAIRGLAPSEITIGGARFENGVYHGLTPAKIRSLAAGVYGNLAWWEGHSTMQVLIEAANEQMDKIAREDINDQLMSHDGLKKLFEDEQMWREARLSDAEEAEVLKERHFFRGKEITLTVKDRADKRTLFDKARDIKKDVLTSADETEIRAIHHRIFDQEIVLTPKEREEKIEYPLGKARMIKAKQKQTELQWALDRQKFTVLASTPGTSIGSIYSAVIKEHMFEYEVPLIDEYNLQKIEENPSHLFSLEPPKKFITPGDPRFRTIRQQLLGGLFASYSRYVRNATRLDAFLGRKIPWAALTGSKADVNQGLFLDLMVKIYGFDNAMELGLQFQQIFQELHGVNGAKLGEGIWQEVDGKHIWIRDGWKRLCQYYFGIDITNRAEVDAAGGDNLREQLTKYFFSDPHRLMQAVYFTNYADPQQQGKGEDSVFEWYYRMVLTPLASGQTMPPSWWVDFPEIEIKRGDKTEKIKIVWDKTRTLSAKDIRVNGVTYVGVRQKAREKADLDPCFNETVVFLPMDYQRKRTISNTLGWLEKNILIVDASKLTTEIPDYLVDPLLDYALKNFPEKTIEELRSWYEKEYEESERPNFNKLLLTSLKTQLDPKANPQGLRLFLFDVFGLDVGDQLKFLTKDKLQINVGAIQKKLPDLGKTIHPPGFIIETVRISQKRQIDFEIARLERLRHLAGGLGQEGKSKIILQVSAALAKAEVEEIARWSRGMAGFTYTKEKLQAIRNKVVAEYSVVTPEMHALFAQWLGEDWENPRGLEELTDLAKRRDWRETWDQTQHALAFSKPLPIISGIFGFFAKLAESEKTANPVTQWLRKWVDGNVAGLVVVSAGNLVFSSTAVFNIVNNFTTIPSATAALGGGWGNLGLATAGAIGSLATNLLLPSIGVFLATGWLSNIGATIWYKWRSQKVPTLDYEDWTSGVNNDIDRE